MTALDGAGLDDASLALLATTFDRAARAGGDLDELGWIDAVEAAPRIAVSSWFEAQGAVCATSDALSRLLSGPIAFGDRYVELGGERVGLDPDLGLVGTPALGRDLPPDVVAIGRLAVGHEMVGAMRTMVEMARTHALDRVQFDRPIAGFQAVRHRLAEAHVAVEAAAAALDGAWIDGSPEAAALAKAVCGFSAQTVRNHCQQVLAGIGFTTEHDFHRYLRRTFVLDNLLGTANSIAAEVGTRSLDRGHLPKMVPL